MIVEILFSEDYQIQRQPVQISVTALWQITQTIAS